MNRFGQLAELAEGHWNQVDSLREKIAERKRFAPELICLGTNEGTFGAEECRRKTGTGDAVAGNYTIWSDWQGNETVDGCDPKKAPGYLRKNENASRQISEAKKAVRENQKSIRQLELELADFRLDQRPAKSVSREGKFLGSIL